MSNVLTILFGVKKSAEEARKKKSKPLGFLGSQSEGYDEAAEELEKEEKKEK